MVIYSFIEYTVGVGAAVLPLLTKSSWEVIKMKNDKELFGLAQMYVTLEKEYQKAYEYDLYDLDEIKKGLENIRNTLFEKGYDIDKFLHYQELYQTMTIKEYMDFIKTLE